MVKKTKHYSDYQRVKGTLENTSEAQLQTVVQLCQIKAKEDLEVRGLVAELPNLLWRFEQRYRGSVNGKQVHSHLNFDGAEPYILVAWKLVS